MNQPSWIQRVEKTARRLTAQWESHGADHAQFSRLALEVFRKAKIHEGFSLEEIYDLLIDQRPWPTQSRIPPAADNAEPTVTLFRDEKDRFLVDLNLWVTGNTSIHDHTTSAANILLLGQSLYSAYRFEGETEENGFSEGNLRLLQIGLHHPGAGYHFPAGPKFIHRLHHIAVPTASLVILLTPHSAVRNRVYLTPRFAAQISLEAQAVARKQIALLNHLRNSQSPDYSDGLAMALQPENGLAVVDVIFDCLSRGDTDFGRILRKTSASKKWIHHLESIATRYAQENGGKNSARNPEHRLFLGLQQTVGFGEEMEKIIKKEFPRNSPTETIGRWAAEMAVL